MSNNNQRNPAFPAIQIVSGDNYNPPKQLYHMGMNLRDYFAAKALQGLISSDNYTAIAATAKEAYAFADAMLEARKQPKKEPKQNQKE